MPEEVVIASKKKGAYQTKERVGYGSIHVGCYQADWCTCCALTQPAKHRLHSVLADEGVAVFLQLEVKAAFCVTKINNLAQKKQTGKKKNHSFSKNKNRLLRCTFVSLGYTACSLHCYREMSLREGEQSGETENNMNFGLLSRQVKNTDSAYTSGKKNKQEKNGRVNFPVKKKIKK